MTNNVSVKDWIALDLINTSATAEIANLFQLPNDLSSGSGTSVDTLGKTLGTITGATTGLNPQIWCPSTNEVYFINTSTPLDNDIYVYSATTNSLVATIATGLGIPNKPSDFFYNEENDSIYVIANLANVYLKINPTNHTFTTIVSTVQPKKFAYEPANKSLYSGGGTGDVEVLDLTTDTVTATFAGLSSSITWALKIPFGNAIYMVGGLAGTIDVINTTTNTIPSTIATGLSNAYLQTNGICDKENLLYVGASALGADVKVIDYKTHTIIDTITTLSNADSVDYYREGNQIFISDTAGARLRVFDCTNQSFVEEVSGGGFSQQYSLIQGRYLYSLSGTGGTPLRVLDMETRTFIRSDAYTGGIRLVNTETYNKILTGEAAAGTTITLLSSAPFLVGSPISVIVESGIGYDALVAELNNGYYELTSVNVYADDITQANQYFLLNERYVSGKSYKNYDYPALPPTTPRFVNINIDLSYNPKPPQILQYKINPLTRVRLIIKYKPVLLTDTQLPDKKLINESLKTVDAVTSYLPQSQIPFLNGGNTTIDFVANGTPMHKLTLIKRVNIKNFMSKFI